MQEIARLQADTTKQGEIDRLMQEIARLQADTTKQGEIDRLTQEIARLRADTTKQDEIDRLRQEIMRLQADTTKQDEIDRLRQEINQLKQDLLRLQALQNTHVTEKSTLEDKLRDLQKSYDADKSAFDNEVEKLADSIEGLQAQTGLLQEQNTNLQAQTRELQVQTGLLQGRNTNLQEQNTNLQAQTRELQVQNTILQAQTEELQGQIKSKVDIAELNAATAQKRTIERLLTDHDTERSQLIEEINRLKNFLAGIKSELEKLPKNKNIKPLITKLKNIPLNNVPVNNDWSEDSILTLNALQNNVNELTKQLVDKDTLITELTGALNTIKTRYDALEREKDKCSEELTDTLVLNTTYKQQLNNIKNYLESKGFELNEDDFLDEFKSQFDEYGKLPNDEKLPVYSKIIDIIDDLYESAHLKGDATNTTEKFIEIAALLVDYTPLSQTYYKIKDLLSTKYAKLYERYDNDKYDSFVDFVQKIVESDDLTNLFNKYNETIEPLILNMQAANEEVSKLLPKAMLGYIDTLRTSYNTFIDELDATFSVEKQIPEAQLTNFNRIKAELMASFENLTDIADRPPTEIDKHINNLITDFTDAIRQLRVLTNNNDHKIIYDDIINVKKMLNKKIEQSVNDKVNVIRNIIQRLNDALNYKNNKEIAIQITTWEDDLNNAELNGLLSEKFRIVNDVWDNLFTFLLGDSCELLVDEKCMQLISQYKQEYEAQYGKTSKITEINTVKDFLTFALNNLRAKNPVKGSKINISGGNENPTNSAVIAAGLSIGPILYYGFSGLIIFVLILVIYYLFRSIYTTQFMDAEPMTNYNTFPTKPPIYT